MSSLGFTPGPSSHRSQPSQRGPCNPQLKVEGAEFHHPSPPSSPAASEPWFYLLPAGAALAKGMPGPLPDLPEPKWRSGEWVVFSS